jgi:hypothetical protein
MASLSVTAATNLDGDPAANNAVGSKDSSQLRQELGQMDQKLLAAKQFDV